jgi:hypothetical protein
METLKASTRAVTKYLEQDLDAGLVEMMAAQTAVMMEPLMEMTTADWMEVQMANCLADQRAPLTARC